MNEQALATAIAAALKQFGGGSGPQYRATPAVASTPYYTGPYGLFGVAGLERDVISTRIQPMGLADRLPVRATNVMSPMFPYLTGFQAGTGSEPTAPCDDPPTAGAGKSCLQTAQFGRISRLTRTLDITRLGEQMNRGEFQDLTFVNDPLLGGMGGITRPGSIPQSAQLKQETLMRMIEVGVDFQNWITRKLFDGNPANNTSGDGYEEFPGLDILISAGKKDALTQTTCPALDSDIKNAAYKRIDTNGEYYVSILSYLMRYLRYNAQHMNFGSVEWAFVMAPSAFWELTSIWPCAYMTYRCTTIGGANNSAVVDAADMVQMRDDMRNGNYLLIDGIRYPVILDNNIQEDTNTNNNQVASGCFSSDLYIVPLTIRGGQPVTYWEYYDFRTSLNILGEGPLATQYYWTDDGRYLWHARPPTNTCFQWFATLRPRLILRTPQLAGRLTNLLYCPIQHERDVRNADPYFANGGITAGRQPPSLFAEWGSVDTH